MNCKETNREGLTFEEWIRAAGFGTLLDSLKLDWQAGVDPSELRANPFGAPDCRDGNYAAETVLKGRK